PDVVTIASILERESKLPKEFPLVSSVIYNRLAKPMRLQLCATVLYKMPEGTTRVTDADTKRESPYNTYVHDGLPVGPISNPGLAALTAAAAPAETKYYYYVLTGKDGSQTFAATYDDFLKAKKVYKDVFGN
ncbi:MAG: endolytic transglycosylase MltG, partial [Actinomycetota bacterium]|nr:endolytic transglycosylase MltG [Actinomycetota bacterium]